MEDDDSGVAVVQLPPARIVTLPELCQREGELGNAQVRFIGRLKTIDCVQGIAVLEDQEASAIVETSQLSVDQQLSRVGGLYSVIGEVDVEDVHRAAPLVRARLVRAVDGLDTSLWEQALSIKRQYDSRIKG